MRDKYPCLRCRETTSNYPKPKNQRTCGSCLRELNQGFRDAEATSIPRGE